MRLSVLDQSPVAAGQTRAAAIRETVALAEAAEQAGFHRFWVAEHHDSPGFAGTTPLVLAMAVLDATADLQVGSGGVLLALHDTRHTAEAFEVLAALHPGRVNIGIGRAGSGGPDNFADKLLDLHQRMGLVPGSSTRSDIDLWLLGAGRGSAPLAAAFGAGYAHAHFLNADSGPAAFEIYRSSFTGGSRRLAPEPLAAVRVIAAETNPEAERLADAVRLWRARKDLGQDKQFPSYSDSRIEHWNREELSRRQANDVRLIVGDGASVALRLQRLAVELGVDELMISTPLPVLEDRIRSLGLIARHVAELNIPLVNS
ncbi:LLM class flavin-dependent oxidoreductase [Arthrobacter sp.]|uniref:LLM class flavin-dependent oxidoreductase n=1 Tax=Arthrobacter sp. TaxID=1667 RepID=UPI0028118B86|nr:LLM class flavin-dependent oxidoreductase [Arthrobacter sp.]